jgi:glutamate-1-semialdehyde 2,1-aminomutase
MFCLYFTSLPVIDLVSAKRSDKDLFAKFFHGCMERGVYFAPSQFEAGFISLAHTSEDLERTGAIAADVLGKI